MAAAAITETMFGIANPFLFVCRTIAAEQHDWVIPTDKSGANWKGCFVQSARSLTGAVASVLYGTLTVNNKGDPYAATTMSIAYDTASKNRSATSFYVATTSGEILEVVDSAPTGASGTLTVLKRGCFGTTASLTGLADDAVLYVLNILLLEDASVSPTILLLAPMPADNGVKLFV